MKLERIETPGISHYAYVLVSDGLAAVIDPRRDVSEYLSVAQAHGARIRYIIETHRQEDFEMGSSYLCALTGAEVVNGTHDCFGRGDLRLADGVSFELGSLTITALHTPGHTPESMCYAVYSPEAPDHAWGVFTGDTLFFGDTGRTDLPGKDKQEENAGRIYDSVHKKLAPLGDPCLVFPAHGPGSVCASGMAERSSSSIGAERLYNKVFICDRVSFVAEKGSERLPRPPYFRHMENVNLKGGRAPVLLPEQVPLVKPEALAQAQSSGGVIIDGREPEAFAGGHIAGSHSVWIGGLPVFGGWVAAPDDSVSLVLRDNDDLKKAVTHLTRIGIDNIAGALAGGFGTWRSSGRPVEICGIMTPKEVAESDDPLTIIDVRDADEYASGHIPGARNIYVGHLAEALDSKDCSFDPDAPIVVTCGVGHRASVGVGIFLQRGYHNVYNLLGGMKAYQALDLAIERGD